MALSRTEIQEYLYQLSSKKGFLTEQEIEKCCDENDADLFDIDKIIQYLIDRKVLIQDENQLNNSDDDEDGYDRAKVDYEAFYNEVLNIYPNQQYLINELRKIQPPQRNEWQTLIPKAKQGNEFARKRIILMYLRGVCRHAFYFSQNFGCDFETCFENAIFGLTKAITSYDITSPQSFPAYQSFYILASLQRAYEMKFSVYEIPKYHYGELFSFLSEHKNIIKQYGIHNLWNYLPDKKIQNLIEKDPDVYNYLQGSCEYNLNQIVYNAKIEELYIYEDLQRVIKIILNTLRDNERIVIIKRFGLEDGNELTLEEVGKLLNVTRERIRQIESKALKKLRLPSNLRLLEGFYGKKIAFNQMKENLYSVTYPDIYKCTNAKSIETFIQDGFSLEYNEFSDMSQ